MTPQDFAYWLQGYFEMQDPHEIGPNQTNMIRNHLKLVFEKKTPEYPEGVYPNKPPFNWVNIPQVTYGSTGDSTKAYC
jgi:hypothetical protein